ncbi:MAG: 16S rRNA (guanine(966)-N(2))-methyltransferase RsmD [Planctomycetes bacterium]|nr:16S rRNA (guanine(966)-N(2))-methyltransferase RsmD [Planctomycetota bacterium]MBI3846911.1 16S rRNA (guanine(966)-N(2))-methyltransferase RsmD [Planctomycetota bacterium]
MRVIGGSRRGFPLVAPEGRSTRPTLDRVRESLFNILASVEDASVLDLYSGSGSFGIEALSRGARHVCFVERDRNALRALEQNLEKTRFVSCATILRTDVLGLREATGCGEPFDLVFADPPFALLRTTDGWQKLGATMTQLDTTGAIGGNPRVVVESEAAFALASAFGPFVLADRRVYGRAAISFFARGA